MNWWAILGYVLALLLAIPTIIVIVRRVSGKRPVWAYKTTKIIGLGSDAPKELQLLFDDLPVSDVWRTYVILINRGRECINKDDVVEKPTICFEDSIILREPVLSAVSDPTTAFSARRADIEGIPQAVELQFEYLDHNDGAVIEVLHTESQQITCSSTIKGAKNKRVECVGEFVPFVPGVITTSVPRFILALLIFAIPILMVVGFTQSTRIEPPPPAFYYPAFIGGVALLVFIMFATVFVSFPWSRSRKFPKWTMNIQIEETTSSE